MEVGTCGIDPANLSSTFVWRNSSSRRSSASCWTRSTAGRRPTKSWRRSGASCPHSKRAGVCLAIENHDRFPCATLAEILDRLDSPCAGICLDTANSLGCLEGRGNRAGSPRAADRQLAHQGLRDLPSACTRRASSLRAGRPARDSSTYRNCLPVCGHWGETPTRFWNSGRRPKPTAPRPRRKKRPGRPRASATCAGSSPTDRNERRSSGRTASPLEVATGSCGVKGGAFKRTAQYIEGSQSPEP